jgi:hypothetical protein
MEEAAQRLLARAFLTIARANVIAKVERQEEDRSFLFVTTVSRAVSPADQKEPIDEVRHLSFFLSHHDRPRRFRRFRDIRFHGGRRRGRRDNRPDNRLSVRQSGLYERQVA